MVQLLKESTHSGGKGTFYPTDSTVDIASRSLWPRNRCRNKCRFHWYKMKWPYHIFGKTLRLLDTRNPKEVRTTDTFSLQNGEGCCGISTRDNAGKSCADVYFVYDESGCGEIDSSRGGRWNDISCHEKRIALCEKARRQIYKHYISVQARLTFDKADAYCARYYGMHYN